MSELNFREVWVVYWINSFGITSNVYLKILGNNPVGKYCSPGCPNGVFLQLSQTSPKDPLWPSWWCPDLTSLRCPDLTSWGRPGMTSRGRRNLTFKGRSWEVDSGRPLEDLWSTPKLRHPKISFNFSLRTYSIDQIYLKACQHSRCIENPVKLLRLSISREIS